MYKELLRNPLQKKKKNSDSSPYSVSLSRAIRPTHGKRSPSLKRVRPRVIHESRQLKSHHRFIPRPSLGQRLPKRHRLRRRNRLPAQARKPRHRRRKQPIREHIAQRKSLVRDGEARYLEYVRPKGARGLAGAVGDTERRGRGLEGGRRGRIERGDVGADWGYAGGSEDPEVTVCPWDLLKMRIF